MSDTIEKTETLWTHLKAYAENNFELMRLDWADRMTDMISLLVAVVWISGLVLLAMIFVGISLAQLLSLITGYYFLGFLIVALLLLAVAYFLWRARKRMIKFPLMNILLSGNRRKEIQNGK